MKQNYSELPEEVKELVLKIQQDAKVYIFNLMTPPTEEYDEEVYNNMKKSIRESLAEKNPFTVFTDEEMQTNITTALEGYGTFGHDFIVNIIEKDPASAKVLFEAVMQDYLDLQNFMSDMTAKMQFATQQAQEIKNESNS